MADGKIRVEQAYAQSKMLNGTSWPGVLPRKITPSDVDLVFDNLGYVILCEFTRNDFPYSEMSTGQRKLYRNLVRNAPYNHVFALCQHAVPVDEQIDTMTDVCACQVMAYRDGQEHWLTLSCEKENAWQRFVECWFEDSSRVIEWIIDTAQGTT